MLPIILRLRDSDAQRTVFAAVMLVLLSAGAVYSIRLGNVLRFGDEFAYYQVAMNLHVHHWFSENGLVTTAYRAPGYPLLLSALLGLHLPIAGLRFFNYLALAGAAALANGLLRQNGFGVAGLLAATLLATYPVLFYTAGTLYPQTMGVFLLLLMLVLGSRNHAPPRSFALAGVVFGLLILCIPSMLSMLPVFALMPWLFCRPRPGRLATLYALSALLVIAPWTIRNYVVFHDFVLVSTNSGVNLLLGNSEHAGRDTGDMVDISRYTGQTHGMTEPQVDRYFRRQSLAWIAHHKPQAIRLYVLKFINFFNYHNKMDTGGVASRLADVLLLLTYSPLLLLFVLRWLLIRTYPPSPLERVLALAYVADALLGAVFFTRIRFRVPFDALLICAAAMFVQTAVQTRLARRIPTSSLSLSRR